MIFFKKPDRHLLLKVLSEKKNAPFTYSPVGYTITNSDAPDGFHLNRFESHLGKGDAVYRKAEAAVRACNMYNIPFSFIFYDEPVPAQGSTLIMVTRVLFLWTMNPVRIVYIGTKQENGDTLFTLSSGTLPGHEEQGEECFTVRLNRNGDVLYELYSFYRSSRPPLRFFNFALKLIVKQFNRESCKVLQQMILHTGS